MSKINWGVRIKNPQFWISIVIVFFANLFAMSGVSFEEITNWGQLGGLVMDALKNPYTFITLGAFVYATVIDYTTTGVFDSKKALTYKKPKIDK